MSHYCSQCGTKTDAGCNFCEGCGADVHLAKSSVMQKAVQPSIKNATNTITSRLGLETIDGFSIKTFFSEVLSKHDPLEVERQLSVGTPDTTPELHESMGNMPNPWIFFRVLFWTIATYLIFLLGWKEYGNANLIPGLIMVGSFAVPCATLILFFELNTPKNISLIRIGQMVVIGGAISLLLSLFIFEATPWLGVFGASAAGIVEEAGKLAALLIAMRAVQHDRYKYRINGLLLGAAMGTGFAAFESAGYALRIGLELSPQAMLDNIQLRGLLSPFGHIAWTAIAASAFWICRPFHASTWDTLMDVRFLKLFLVPIVLHFIWNLPFAGPFKIKYILLGFVAWVVIISLVQSGHKEVAQLAKTKPD